MAAEPTHRSRPGPLLALGQVRYQLLLLLRSPLGFFLNLFIPLLLLVVLNVLKPGGAATVPGVSYAQFLTPAMTAFALLNTAYVTTITALVLAREEGVLKRLRGTPLPAWTYLTGRSGQVLVTSIISAGVIIGTGVLFFGVHVVWGAFGYFVAAALLGLASFFLIGVVVSMLVPKTETALPVAFGTMLPVAFISDVFFSSVHTPRWLHDLASALPVAPVARAMEASFSPATTSWPMPTSGLLVSLAWCVGAALIIAFGFRWEPGAIRIVPWPRSHPHPRHP